MTFVRFPPAVFGGTYFAIGTALVSLIARMFCGFGGGLMTMVLLPMLPPTFVLIPLPALVAVGWAQVGIVGAVSMAFFGFFAFCFGSGSEIFWKTPPHDS